ncbi:MAG: hypothetical protein EBU46_14595, partial [Nitrosomonadaceae bacterium]|nr:hypothetical protein [Nitrosomonadaceae bacterium]
AASLLAARVLDINHVRCLVRGTESCDRAALNVVGWLLAAASLFAAWHLLIMQNTNSIQLTAM